MVDTKLEQLKGKQMTDSPVSLASLMTPSKTVTVDFPGYDGMSVDLTYLAREELYFVACGCGCEDIRRVRRLDKGAALSPQRAEHVDRGGARGDEGQLLLDHELDGVAGGVEGLGGHDRLRREVELHGHDRPGAQVLRDRHLHHGHADVQHGRH